ncbi:pyridoxamine 5'-phosphate oxidase family protein [Egicoccus halophilus]|uniref:pyridoxamine 5'-phosphate oxidase family protein n=1 Tax=Egicoccus halophilus TaxID=1670830 RepID=UPI00197A813F|nr:pyridoxamine 5'-phosphate oxidase family protein [Egicoccus halophilus]
MSAFLPDDLLRVRRHPERGTTSREVVHSILDAGLVCHLGYLHGDRPVVVPTLYGRDGDELVVHGSAASRAMRAGATGLPVCVTVMLLDALVLARSAFHHSLNYRSVVVHGEAQAIEDPDDKTAALRTLTEHATPGRWAEVRWPTPQELRATTVLRLSLDGAVAKVRAGGVGDDEADLDLPVWAGVVPVATSWGEAVATPGLADGLVPPASVVAAASRPSLTATGVPAGLSASLTSGDRP